MLQQLLAVGVVIWSCYVRVRRWTRSSARVGADQTAGVLVACLPPAGLSPARYLCKRLRAEFPN